MGLSAPSDTPSLPPETAPTLKAPDIRVAMLTTTFSQPSTLTSPKAPFSHTLFDPKISKEKIVFIKMISWGIVINSVVVLGVLSIFWGSLHGLKVDRLGGIIVDFDQGDIGQAVIASFREVAARPDQLNWLHVEHSRYAGPQAVADAIIEAKHWAAIVINPDATTRLENAVIQGDATYRGSAAVTVYAAQARNELAYTFIIPSVHLGMQNAAGAFAISHARALANTTALPTLLQSAPQIITEPLGYLLENLRPFDVQTAQAPVFVGLVFKFLVSFVLTLVNLNARMTSGLSQKLDLRSLIILRIVTPFCMYFCVSWAYSFLSLIFQVPFNRYYGSGGFLIYWAMSFLVMAALGLAIEALVTVLTPRFIPYFLLLWVITNASVAKYPIEVFPAIFRYGYAAPIYNASMAIRSVIFNTKNELGLNFAIQFTWIALSLTTLIILQFFMRRKESRDLRRQSFRTVCSHPGAGKSP